MDESLEVALKGGMFKRLIESQFSETRQKYNLKKVDLEVLYFLAHNREQDTPTCIYQHLRLNRGHVSQAIDALYRRGLIFATPDSTDRRLTHYAISDSANGIIAEMEKVHEYLDQKIFCGISKEEIEQYKITTQKIMNNIETLYK